MTITMKKPAEKGQKNRIQKLLQTEHDYITNLLLICDVPYKVNEDENDELYINTVGKKANRKPVLNGVAKEETDDEVVTEIMSNKHNSKKVKLSERGIKKREARKIKKDKKMKKTLVSVAKSQKNSVVKKEKAVEDSKVDVKAPFKPVYNSNGKLVFSKFDFAAGAPSMIKKKKGNKNPAVALEEIKKADKEVKDLIAGGEKEKALGLKSDMAWRKAFDRVEGKKIKDNPELLKRTLHKKEVKKHKSKVGWKDRTQKQEEKQEFRLKKRQDNINKKISDKKKHKMKRLSKKGRVIPGF